jgi:hypothetical protein
MEHAVQRRNRYSGFLERVPILGRSSIGFYIVKHTFGSAGNRLPDLNPLSLHFLHPFLTESLTAVERMIISDALVERRFNSGEVVFSCSDS